ncbi:MULTISPECIES: hypothetical protein [unclassified Brevibacterium]|uniref:hypothetical protein n=1 Tax=unclassified Brevibacterium TaxID=2614124 RepID=UPI001E647F4F|nr:MULTISPECIES: hypothetical protein [unclassified Brevibacterium]MCD1287342.1 hypothetical protein [Brevibacterium sp. CCUG 69071]MDK8436403.1 hypothetical protein [Brevibacterium sp. H-BE7]
MAETFDHFKHAYDKRTGEKLPHKVPESYFEIFPETLSPAAKPQVRSTAPIRPTTSPEVASVVEVVNKQEGK